VTDIAAGGDHPNEMKGEGEAEGTFQCLLELLDIG